MSEVFDLLKSIFSPKGNKDTSVIVKNYINGNNNSSNNSSNNHNNQQKSKKTQKTSNSKSISNSSIRLKSIRLYSTGSKGKVYTNHFYKSMNHNFGVEIQIRNNTSRSQSVKIGGCVYNSNNQPEVRWLGTKVIKSTSSTSYDFYVRENTFSKMKEGKYKIQFWINDKKVQREFFVVTYK